MPFPEIEYPVYVIGDSKDGAMRAYYLMRLADGTNAVRECVPVLSSPQIAKQFYDDHRVLAGIANCAYPLKTSATFADFLKDRRDEGAVLVTFDPPPMGEEPVVSIDIDSVIMIAEKLKWPKES